jgi:hypothetical protein
MPETGRQRDHEAHMGRCQLMESRFVPVFLPTHREKMFFFPFKKGCVHGGADEPAANP